MPSAAGALRAMLGCVVPMAMKPTFANIHALAGLQAGSNRLISLAIQFPKIQAVLAMRVAAAFPKATPS